MNPPAEELLQDENPEQENPEDENPEDENLPDENLPDDESFDDDEDAFSLEELGAAYKHLVASADSPQWETGVVTGEVLRREQLLAAQAVEQSEAEAEAALHASESGDDDDDGDEVPSPTEEPDAAATPEAIIEAALFVGNPNGNGVTAARLASIMRDMTPEEVATTIDGLNDSYRSNRQGIRIASDESGYRLVVAPEVESIRHVFTGKVRETRLNQASIEVLSLVAYQPGITAGECTDKRGRDSGSLLNQMVRRRLIEMKREPEHPVAPEPGDRRSVLRTENEPDERNRLGEPSDNESEPAANKKKPVKVKLVSRFYPAERLLVLLGLDSLEDLPQVEEAHLE